MTIVSKNNNSNSVSILFKKIDDSRLIGLDESKKGISTYTKKALVYIILKIIYYYFNIL